MAGQDSPLFDSLDDATVDHIVVYRVDPVAEEGMIGKLPPDATEFDVRNRYGGGTFSLVAKDAASRHVKGGKRRIVIAGDPIFTSTLAEQKYLKQNGLLPAPAALAQQHFPQMQQPRDPSELLITMFKMQSDQAALSHRQNMETLQAENRRRDEDAKRQAEERNRQNEDERRRDREHQKFMLEMLAGKNDSKNGMAETLKLLAVAKDLFGGGGDGERDPLSILAEGIPAMIAGARENPGAMQAPTRPGGPPERPPHKTDVTLTGDTAIRAREFVTLAKAIGVSPQQAMDAMLDEAIQRARAIQQQQSGGMPPRPPQRGPGRPPKRPVAAPPVETPPATANGVKTDEVSQ
jgi:hypothetical protein